MIDIVNLVQLAEDWETEAGSLRSGLSYTDNVAMPCLRDRIKSKIEVFDKCARELRLQIEVQKNTQSGDK